MKILVNTAINAWTKLRIINGKEALEYLKDTGFEISDTTWYREKNKLEKMKLKDYITLLKLVSITSILKELILVKLFRK